MATHRSMIYRFLAVVYQKEIGVEEFNNLNQPEISEALEETGFRLSGDFYRRPQEQVLEDLAVEYCRLFIGPGKHFPPYESVHRGEFVAGTGEKGLLMGEAAMEVSKFVKECGLEFDASYRGLPDHLGVELELMGQLTAWEASSWLEEDLEDAHTALDLQDRFMSEHLMRWVPGFCQKLADASEVPFYRDVALLTKEFAVSDLAIIQELKRVKGDVNQDTLTHGANIKN